MPEARARRRYRRDQVRRGFTGEIALAEVHTVSQYAQGELKIVIDDQSGARLASQLSKRSRLFKQPFATGGFVAVLKQARTAADSLADYSKQAFGIRNFGRDAIEPGDRLPIFRHTTSRIPDRGAAASGRPASMTYPARRQVSLGSSSIGHLPRVISCPKSRSGIAIRN